MASGYKELQVTYRNVIPSYVTEVIRTNKRRFISRMPVFAVQDQTDPTYDAYDVDIGRIVAT